MERDYYIIKPGMPYSDTKNIYPQIFASFLPMELDPLTQLENKKGNRVPEKFILRMDPKTRLTDFVSQSRIGAKGLLMSLKSFEVIKNFKIQCEHKIYYPKIEFKGKTHDYIWLNPTKNFESEIDFEKTEFFKYDFIEEITKSYKAKNVKDLSRQLLDDYSIGNFYAKEIFLSNDEVFQYDLFMIYFGISEIMISKELLVALKESKLTGFEVVDQPIKFKHVA